MAPGAGEIVGQSSSRSGDCHVSSNRSRNLPYGGWRLLERSFRLALGLADPRPTTTDLISRVLPRRYSSSRHPRAGRFTTPLFLLISALLYFASSAAAVRIPFQNCLPDSYRLNDPRLLQWVPLHAEASFNLDDDIHNLQLTVWGNVTGSRSSEPLPPPDDPHWGIDDARAGKIIQTERPGELGSLATTLYRKINVLTYEPWDNGTDFCENGLINGTCPLGPVFDTEVEIPYGLPAVDLSNDMLSSYAFTSFSATFLIIYGDDAATQIGCISATITPALGGVEPVLRFLPLLVLLLTGVAVIFAAIFSPWGTSNIFHWTTNYGRDADLLRLVTPGFGDCLHYIQFIILTGGLSLNYPGFFQPIVSQVGWSTLMFDQSFVTGEDSWQSVVDGIYVTNATYGLHEIGQLIGMAESEDIWGGMMVWLCVIIVSVLVLIQAGFLAQWLYRSVNKTPEEDLQAKNLPFSIGNVVRIIFNYFLMPIVALSSFQFVISAESPAYVVALAAVTLILLLGFAAWLLFLIVKSRPRSVLFDDLPTVLLYGPLYNTFSDEAAAFALIPMLLNVIRGISIGAVQPSGIAQVVLLAICEVIQILTLHAFRPFASPTSMNAYHTIFSALRLSSILLMVAFTPTLGVTEGPKGWIGYAILLIHGLVLVFGFFLNALQRIIEVVARQLGAGQDDVHGLTRGGLSKIFGMRQLSRRVDHRSGPSRASQISTSAMLASEEASKSGFPMTGGRLRSESAASMGGIAMANRRRNSSALDSIDMLSEQRRNIDSGSSYFAGTPGGASTFSFLGTPTTLRQVPPGVSPETINDPYYRPPRRRQGTLSESINSDFAQRQPSRVESRRDSQVMAVADAADTTEEISRAATPAPPTGGFTGAMASPPNRPDYATREVDFYYGVRGPALNSDGMGRKLGTGPADPTGPMATATGWFRSMLGGKTKEKGKGFEVVRSARMPPAMMARNGTFGDESPPEGIPVAMGVLRNGPIDSDDDEPTTRPAPRRRSVDLLTDDGNARNSEGDEPVSPITKRGSVVIPSDARATARSPAGSVSHTKAASLDVPGIPRKSSKRNSALLEQGSYAPSLDVVESRSSASNSSSHKHTTSGTSRLPFERTESQRRLSAQSSTNFSSDLIDVDIQGPREERPASFGMVSQHGISRVDPVYRNVDLLGSQAELVDERDGHSPG